jgi:hypothetical protein
MDIRHKIAEEIYVSGWLESVCKMMCRNDEQLVEDLMMEILLIVMEFKPDSKLEESYNKGQHLFFIKRIINNQYNSTTSPFYKKYRKFAALTQTELIDDTNGDKETD